MRQNFRINLIEWMFRGIFFICIVLIGLKLDDILTGQTEEKVFVPVALLTEYRNDDDIRKCLKLNSKPKLKPNPIRMVHSVIEEKVKYV